MLIKDSFEFCGEIVETPKIAARRNQKRILFKTKCGEVRDFTLEDALFEQITKPIPLDTSLRIYGRGDWRIGDINQGRWILQAGEVDGFEIVKEETLSEVVARIRSMDIDWPDDMHQRIEDFRNDNG